MTVTPTDLPEDLPSQGRLVHTRDAWRAVNAVTAAWATKADKEDLVWTLPSDYGIDLTGGTTHTAAQVQAWLDAGPAFAVGTIKCSGTVTIKHDADLHLVTWLYTGTSGVAIHVGVLNDWLFSKLIILPHVTATAKTNLGWAQVAGTVGVQLNNCFSSLITIPYVGSFETGLKVYGSPRAGSSMGTQQLNLYLGHLDNNKVNWAVSPLQGTGSNDSGWANQCTVHGGRMSHNSAEGVQVSGTRHILLSNCWNLVNGWIFEGTSLESPDVVEYHVECSARGVILLGCRYENTGPDSHRRFWNRHLAKDNLVIGGMYSDQLNQVNEATALRFDLLGNGIMTLVGGSATQSVVTLENNFSSTGGAFTVMEPGAAQAGSNPETDYALKASARKLFGKRSTDTVNRAVLDVFNGQLFLGNGTAEPDAFLAGWPGVLYGNGHFRPWAHNTFDVGAATERWRDVYASRHVRIGSIYLRDNAGVLEKSTDGSSWSAV